MGRLQSPSSTWKFSTSSLLKSDGETRITPFIMITIWNYKMIRHHLCNAAGSLVVCWRSLHTRRQTTTGFQLRPCLDRLSARSIARSKFVTQTMHGSTDSRFAEALQVTSTLRADRRDRLRPGFCVECINDRY